MKPASEGGRRRLAGQIVFRGTQSAGRDHDVGAGERAPEGRLQEGGVVGDGDPRPHLHPQLPQFLGQVEGVGGGTERGEEFTAHGQDLGPEGHVTGQTRSATRRIRLA